MTYEFRQSLKVILLVTSIVVSACNNGSDLNQKSSEKIQISDTSSDYIFNDQGNSIRSDMSFRINRLIEQKGLPSVTIVAFNANEIVWAESFGMANIAQKTEADLDTVYNTASTFKIIVATAVMQLVEDEVIGLDDPINQHLSVPITESPDTTHPLTIRHMLAHRSGFKNARAFKDTDIWSRLPVPSLEEQISTLRFDSLPGEKYSYCNVCFNLWTDMIQTASGRNLETYLRDEILIPVDSKITSPLYPDATMTERFALPYEQFNGQSYAVPQKFLHTLQAGDTYMRPLDMAKFLQSHLDGGQSSSKRVLSDHYVQMMRERQFGGNITLGFEHAVEDGITNLSWDGGIVGGSTVYELEPKHGIGVYIASNSHSSHGDLQDIAQRTRDLLRGDETPYEYEVDEVEHVAVPILSRDKLQAYVGSYRIEGTEIDLKISVLNETLALTNPAGDRLRVIFLTDLQAALSGTNGERIEFRQGDKNAIKSLVLTSGDTSFSAYKIP